jgi:hypothetical protein
MAEKERGKKKRSKKMVIEGHTLISCPLQKFKMSSFGSIGTSISVPSTPVLSSPLQQLQVSFQGTRFTEIVFLDVQLVNL